MLTGPQIRRGASLLARRCQGKLLAGGSQMRSLYSDPEAKALDLECLTEYDKSGPMVIQTKL